MTTTIHPDEDPMNVAQVVGLHPSTTNPERSAVVVGDPIEGINLYGPFDNPVDAADYGERFHTNETWWVVDITTVQCNDDGTWVEPPVNTTESACIACGHLAAHHRLLPGEGFNPGTVNRCRWDRCGCPVLTLERGAQTP